MKSSIKLVKVGKSGKIIVFLAAFYNLNSTVKLG